MSDSILSLTNYSEAFIYIGLFLILFFCGLGLPIPEEITLLTGGFLIHLGIIRFYPTLAVGLVGVLIGDIAMYSIGRKWGHGIITHQHLRKIFSENRLGKVRQFFHAHGSKTVFIARFIMGFRIATFLAAGTMGMKPLKFILLDLLGAVITVPVLLFLGYYFGMNIAWLGDLFTEIDFLLKLLLVIGIAFVIGIYFWFRKKAVKER